MEMSIVCGSQTVQKFRVNHIFFFKEVNTYVVSKDVLNVSNVTLKAFNMLQCCSFELSYFLKNP